MAVSAAIERFIYHGDADPGWSAWDGDHQAGSAALRRVLERILQHRAAGAPLGLRSVPVDASEILLRRITSIVFGLFPDSHAQAVLEALPSRMYVVTVQDFAAQVRSLPVEDAWCLANIVLEDMGAPPLSDDAPQLDGICTADAMWVPPGAFRPATPTVDVLVHEVAHLFHTVDRSLLGLSGVGPMWRIPADAHETFAYACELWACRERTPPSERTGVAESVEWVRMADARVDMESLRDLLLAADTQGWQAIRAWAEAQAE